MVFNKDDLIIAAERKNPIPLLQSIFRTNYPGKEVMKENIKMYYNTMKPMGNSDNSVDYTKNERWKFRELFLELRDREKNKKTELDNNNSLNYTPIFGNTLSQTDLLEEQNLFPPQNYKANFYNIKK